MLECSGAVGVPAKAVQDHAEEIPRLRVRRVDRQGRAQRRFGRIVSPQFREHQSVVHPVHDIVRRNRIRARKQADALAHRAQADAADAQHVQRLRLLRGKRQDLQADPRSLVEAPRLREAAGARQQGRFLLPCVRHRLQPS